MEPSDILETDFYKKNYEITNFRLLLGILAVHGLMIVTDVNV